MLISWALLLAVTASAAAPADVTDADLDRVSGGTVVSIGSPAAGGRASTIPLEIYVARVLAGEAEPQAPDAAMQAMAIAVRTFAMFNLKRHAREGFDLCDTTHCQVMRAATAATRRAARATAGQVLTYRGSVAEVFYSASCGGHTESASEVWPNSRLPYLRSVSDDVHGDDTPWTLDLSLAAVEKVLRGEGFKGRLTAIAVDARNTSGRVSRLRLKGLEPSTIGGAEFRMAMGPTAVKSTAFAISKRDKRVHLVGRGYGHGVGMCTVGASRRARRGESAAAILQKYYPGLVIGRN